MATEIIAAIIGGGAVIIAALITLYSQFKRNQIINRMSGQTSKVDYSFSPCDYKEKVLSARNSVFLAE